MVEIATNLVKEILALLKNLRSKSSSFRMLSPNNSRKKSISLISPAKNLIAKEIRFFAGDIKLMDFLRELLGDNILNDDDFERRFFRSANISFTRFVAISTIPTTNDIKKCYEDGIAFNLKRNQRGADFLIPVYTENRFTFWIIQVNNHNLTSTVFEKSDLAVSNEPYLAM